MEELADQGDHREINADDGSGGECVREAALENDVHVHQAVADDGVPKAERDERERIHGQFHPRRRDQAEDVRDDVEECERKTAGEGTGGDPLQLLPQHTAGRAAEAEKKNEGGDDKINSEIGLFDFVEPVACSDGRQEIQRTGSDEEMKNEKRERESVHGQKLGPEAATALRKNEREMNEQGGL